MLKMNVLWWTIWFVRWDPTTNSLTPFIQTNQSQPTKDTSNTKYQAQFALITKPKHYKCKCQTKQARWWRIHEKLWFNCGIWKWVTIWCTCRFLFSLFEGPSTWLSVRTHGSLRAERTAWLWLLRRQFIGQPFRQIHCFVTGYRMM